MVRLKKFFSKRAFLSAGATYLLVAAAYAIGYATHTGGGFIDFGPAFSGAALAMLAAPILLIIGVVYLATTQKKLAIIGYLSLTIGVFIVLFGTARFVPYIISTVSISSSRKHAESFVLDYLDQSYGDVDRFSLTDISYFTDSNGDNVFSFRAKASNLGFAFTVNCDLPNGRITYDSYSDMRVHAIVNEKMKKEMDHFFGGGNTLHVRWDNLTAYFVVYPPDITAEEVLAQSYPGFDPMIFVCVDTFDEETERQRYLTIVRDYCLNEFSFSEGDGRAKPLQDMHFSIYYMNQKDRVLFDDMQSDYSKIFDSCYATISLSYINYFLDYNGEEYGTFTENELLEAISENLSVDIYENRMRQ